MIDVFLRTNTPIAGIPAALAGFDCERICVRNGGPTEVWQRTPDGWIKDQPGMTLYDDLVPAYIDLSAFRYDRATVTSGVVSDGLTLRLSDVEASEWLAAMEEHRYAIEDAIGCSVNVDNAGRTIDCAAALFAVSDFKNITDPAIPLGKKLLAWVDRIVARGADQVGIAISLGERFAGQN